MGPSTPWTISSKGQWYFINILEKEYRERGIRTHHPWLMPPNSAPTRKAMVTSHKEPGSSISQTVAPHTAPGPLGGQVIPVLLGLGHKLTSWNHSQRKSRSACHIARRMLPRTWWFLNGLRNSRSQLSQNKSALILLSEVRDKIL